MVTQGGGGLVRGLLDNGASYRVSCSKTLDGAVRPSKASAAEKMVVGKSSNSLESTGSYLYLHERYAANGVGDVALRTMKHTPELSVPVVYSEPTESKDHGYTFEQMPYTAQRTMTPPDGPCMQLFMSSSLLGWLKVRPVTRLQPPRPAQRFDRPAVPGLLVEPSPSDDVEIQPYQLRPFGHTRGHR